MSDGEIIAQVLGLHHKREWRLHYLRATEYAIEEAERAIGFPLPALLRRLYLEVANGGFGPFCAVIGVNKDGYSAWEPRERLALAEVYADCHDPEMKLLPDGMVPVLNWGCRRCSCVDCTIPSGPVYHFVGDYHSLQPDMPSLAEWFAAWLADPENFCRNR
jgi:hypothetical protein